MFDSGLRGILRIGNPGGKTPLDKVNTMVRKTRSSGADRTDPRRPIRYYRPLRCHRIYAM